MCQFLFNINIATTIIISPFSLSMFIYKPLSISSSLNSLQQIVYAKLYFNKLQIINHKSYFMISEWKKKWKGKKRKPNSWYISLSKPVSIWIYLKNNQATKLFSTWFYAVTQTLYQLLILQLTKMTLNVLYTRKAVSRRNMQSVMVWCVGTQRSGKGSIRRLKWSTSSTRSMNKQAIDIRKCITVRTFARCSLFWKWRSMGGH